MQKPCDVKSNGSFQGLTQSTPLPRPTMCLQPSWDPGKGPGKIGNVLGVGASTACELPVAAVTNDYELGALKQQKFTLPQPGGQDSEIQVSAGLVPSGSPEGECPLPCAWLWRAASNPWLWPHHSDLHLPLHRRLSCVSSSPLMRTPPVTAVRALDPDDPTWRSSA